MTFRHFAAALIVAAASASAAAEQAPVSIRLEMEHSEFVSGEPLRTAVLITNMGVSPYIADDYGVYTNNTVSVYLKTRSGRMLFPDGSVPELKEFMIPANATKKIIFDLRKLFPGISEGQYMVQADANSPEGTSVSQVKSFSVVPGLEILSAVRAREGIGRSEFLKYSLLSWNRDGSDTLFLRVDNVTDGRLFAFAKIGTFVTMSKPVLTFQGNREAKIVHQTSRDDFIITRLFINDNSLSLVSRTPVRNPASVMEELAVREVSDAIDAKEAKEKEKRKGFFKRVNVSSERIRPSLDSQQSEGDKNGSGK